MMKKLCAIALILLLLVSPIPSARAQQGAVGISTREELMQIASDPSGDYVLTADIDLSGEPWTPIPFSGTLDGAGHTIGNLTVSEPGAETATVYDGNRKQYDAVFGGLFSVATDAEIKNLRLLNAKITIETDRDCLTGAIAGYAERTVLTDCTVQTRSTLTISSIDAGVGGLVGFADTCVFDHCTVDAELVFLDVNPDVLCEEFLGGVYACGHSDVKDCSVHTRGYAEIYGYAHNGGVVGMFKLPRNYKGKTQSIRDTSVDAEIRFFEVTPSKRAYCDPILGENCGHDCYLTHNKTLHFDSAYDATAVPKRPESCESPAYTETVTEPTCSEWGYTTYTCSGCGYSYRDDYTFPQHKYQEEIVESATCTKAGEAAYTCVYCGDSYTETIPTAPHVPGDWTVTKEAAPGTEGEETLFCTVCGTVLDTRALPAIAEVIVEAQPAVQDITSESRFEFTETVIELLSDESVELPHLIDFAGASVGTMRFESDDPTVAAVDENGTLTALNPGTTTIRAYGADGVEASVSVLVTAKPQEQTHSLFSRLRCG